MVERCPDKTEAESSILSTRTTMRAILFHLKEYKAAVTGLATRPVGILPEPLNTREQEAYNAILAFVTIEKADFLHEEKIEKLSNEIEKFFVETKAASIVICPFAHLSNDLAPSSECLPLFQIMESKLSESYPVMRGHFGSDKELFLHLYGHPGNVRYREF